MSGKRHEGKEADNLKGGDYEAAVNQEKEDDRRSHRELVGGTLPQQTGSGGDQEEVSVAALNVRAKNREVETFSCLHIKMIYIYTDATRTTAIFNPLKHSHTSLLTSNDKHRLLCCQMDKSGRLKLETVDDLFNILQLRKRRRQKKPPINKKEAESEALV